jgi:hypothetical protein
MGRSSNSSHYQLSANRLISRVHVKARYIPATAPLEPNKVEIICNGWNGLKLHCQGRTWDLAKGDTFTSETENAEIMLDVQDARVMVQWPKKDRHESIANLSDSSWDESPRPRPHRNGSASELLQSSPLRRQTRVKSPESPTPANKSSSSLDALLANDEASEPVQIYEDPSADEQELPDAALDVGMSFAQTDIMNSFSSDLSEPDDENDPDEENDPIVHSFGPFGANLSNRLAAFTADSPCQPTRVSSGDSTAIPSVEPELPLNSNIDVAAVTNHVVNQLAYSRLSSNPLSAIMNNLPTEEKKDLSKDDLRRIIESTDCIGTIPRQGKDAAGKVLESEYYYVPERDTDDSRRLAVTDGLRKPSLRACRKQHKVSRLTTILAMRVWSKLTVIPSNIIGNDPKHPDWIVDVLHSTSFAEVLSCFLRCKHVKIPFLPVDGHYRIGTIPPLLTSVCIAKGVLCHWGPFAPFPVFVKVPIPIVDCLSITSGSAVLSASGSAAVGGVRG